MQLKKRLCFQYHSDDSSGQSYPWYNPWSQLHIKYSSRELTELWEASEHNTENGDMNEKTNGN